MDLDLKTGLIVVCGSLTSAVVKLWFSSSAASREHAKKMDALHREYFGKIEILYREAQGTLREVMDATQKLAELAESYRRSKQ